MKCEVNDGVLGIKLLKKSVLILVYPIILFGCSSRQPVYMDSDDYEGYSSLLASSHVCHANNLFVDDLTLDYITKLHNLHVAGLAYEDEVFQSFYSKKEKYYRANISEDVCKHVASNYNDFYSKKTTEFQKKIHNRSVIRERKSKRFTMILSAIAEGLNSNQAFNAPIQNTPVVTPITGSKYNVNILPAPSGYEKTYVPTGTVGVLRNSSITNSYKLCEYNTGRATRLPMGQQCPRVLK